MSAVDDLRRLRELLVDARRRNAAEAVKKPKDMANGGPTSKSCKTVSTRWTKLLRTKKRSQERLERDNPHTNTTLRILTAGRHSTAV
jgi:hypothetical protein